MLALSRKTFLRPGFDSQYDLYLSPLTYFREPTLYVSFCLGVTIQKCSILLDCGVSIANTKALMLSLEQLVKVRIRIDKNTTLTEYRVCGSIVGWYVIMFSEILTTGNSNC